MPWTLDVYQSRSQSFVPLGQRSENESSGSIHFEITMGNNRILVIRLTAQSQSASISCYGACLKWLLPELSFSDRWSRGTKLWERDWCVASSPGRSSCVMSSGKKKIRAQLFKGWIIISTEQITHPVHKTNYTIN